MERSNAGTAIERFTFQHDALTAQFHALAFRGRETFVARELGRALDYTKEGGGLVELITGEWSGEFVLGHDYFVVDGAELDELKRLTGSYPVSPIGDRARSVMLLSEHGFFLACTKTSKPLGVALRRWLVDEVLPKLRRGQGIPSRDEQVVDSHPVARELTPAEFGVMLSQMSARESNAWSKKATKLRQAYIDAQHRRDPKADEHYVAWMSFALGRQAPPPPAPPFRQMVLGERATPASPIARRTCVTAGPFEIETIEHVDGTSWVSIARVCGLLGAKPEKQVARLQKRTWATLRDLGPDDGICIATHLAPMWLSLIDPRSVAPDAVEKLGRFQIAAMTVLAASPGVKRAALSIVKKPDSN